MTTPQPTRQALAIALLVLTGALLSSMDAFAKYLSQEHAVLFILWGRYFFHSVLNFSVLSLRGDFAFLKPRRPGLQILRAGFLLGATGCMYVALSLMPLAEATAIMFLNPLIITALSIPMLGEKVGARRWTAIVIGFVGILLIVKPGSDAMNPAAILPLIAAVSVSMYILMTQIMRDLDDANATNFYTTAVGTVLFTAMLPFTYEDMSGFNWMLMIAMGGCGLGGHFLLMKAFHMAPASLLAPFGYAHLVFAAIIGFIVFGDVPDLVSIIGALIIVGSGLYVWYRETFEIKTPHADLSSSL